MGLAMSLLSLFCDKVPCGGGNPQPQLSDGGNTEAVERSLFAAPSNVIRGMAAPTR